jgi:putative transposase
MNRKTFKFRLYPTPAQETTLRETLETCREVYNSLLNQRKHDFELSGKSLSCYDQQNHLPLWKDAHPELCDVFSQVLQNVAKRVDLAFQAFFRRVKAGETPGYPRFKGKGQYDSITYPQAGFKVLEQSVYLSKIGTLKAVLHRRVDGKVKTCTVQRQGKKWYVFFSCEVEAEPLPASAEKIGIDVGLSKFAALSNGEIIENPRFFRNDQQELAKAQHKFDKVKNKHRSPARRKAKKVIGRIHERIKNRRHDFVHQLARKLVNRFGLIAVEELHIENMMATPKAKPDPENLGQFLSNGAAAKGGLNKSIADASWSMFRALLTQKAENAAREVIAVNPAHTSQDCSGCGYRPEKDKRKTLAVRVHVCPCCCLVLDRDVNAARNILIAALYLLKIAVGQHSVPA